MSKNGKPPFFGNEESRGSMGRPKEVSSVPGIVEVLFSDRHSSWINQISNVLGTPHKVMDSESDSGSGQETAIYYLPKTNKSVYNEQFMGVVLTVSRAFVYEDPYFKLHIRSRKPKQNEEVLYQPSIVAIQINTIDHYVEFWSATGNEFAPVARVFPSGEVIKEGELISNPNS